MDQSKEFIWLPAIASYLTFHRKHSRMGTHSLKEPCGLDAFTVAMQTGEKMFDRDPVT